MTDDEWERWKTRLLGLILSLISIVILVNELILRALAEKEVSEARVVGALGLLGLPVVLGRAGKIGKDNGK